MEEEGKAKWERLEEFLFEMDEGSTFSAAEYAAEEGVDIEVATFRIQDYLRAQRRDESHTLYVLYRVPGTRTRAARWTFGIRASDARALSAGLVSDVKAKVMAAFVPDLQRIAARNPRAAKAVESQITAVVEGALKVLEAAVSGTDA